MTDKVNADKKITRREFLKDAGLIAGGAALGSVALVSACGGTTTVTAPGTTTTKTSVVTSNVTSTVAGPGATITTTVTGPGSTTTMPPVTTTVTPPPKTIEVKAIPAPSKAYLVVDSKKCCGCLTCMMACSLVNEGKESSTLSRIQVTQSSFEAFPNVTQINVCRQCLFPPCVSACPNGSLSVNADGVRTIDSAKCNGCKLCVAACPHEPHRIIWNPETNKAMKCDLCASAKYWSQGGGANGKQACVESCSMDAIKLVKETPIQEGDIGYNVNLRTGKYPLYRGN